MELGPSAITVQVTPAHMPEHEHHKASKAKINSKADKSKSVVLFLFTYSLVRFTRSHGTPVMRIPVW